MKQITKKNIEFLQRKFPWPASRYEFNNMTEDMEKADNVFRLTIANLETFMTYEQAINSLKTALNIGTKDKLFSTEIAIKTLNCFSTILYAITEMPCKKENTNNVVEESCFILNNWMW